jgi:Holliday junction resolvase RusA-like endonuclease
MIEHLYEFEIEIPLTAPSLNKWYAGVHWRTRQKTAKQWHETVHILCLENKLKPITEYPVILETQSYFKDKRKRDSSNYSTANKLCEDGLVKAGILKDDNGDYVAGNFTYTPILGAKENKTILTVRKAYI